MLTVCLFLSSLAVNHSLFNRTTVPSTDELLYSSTATVSALGEGRDCMVCEVRKCRAFLLGRADRSGIDRMKKTLPLTLPRCPSHCDNVTLLLLACSLDPPRISRSAAYGTLCAPFGNMNSSLIAATFLQSHLCVLAGCKWFSRGISQIQGGNGRSVVASPSFARSCFHPVL